MCAVLPSDLNLDNYGGPDNTDEVFIGGATLGYWYNNTLYKTRKRVDTFICEGPNKDGVCADNRTWDNGLPGCYTTYNYSYNWSDRGSYTIIENVTYNITQNPNSFTTTRTWEDFGSAESDRVSTSSETNVCAGPLSRSRSEEHSTWVRVSVPGFGDQVVRTWYYTQQTSYDSWNYRTGDNSWSDSRDGYTGYDPFPSISQFTYSNPCGEYYRYDMTWDEYFGPYTYETDPYQLAFQADTYPYNPYPPVE
jgi:hypothetical protein